MTKKQIKLIEKTKAKIQALSKQQDKIYENLLEELGIKAHSLSDAEWIFDYVFNDFGAIPEEEID